ncbi:MAG: methylenetetrahydrofolate reductase [NAD(P)H] [Planctomycetales bacterium]|nr:methylenetetrahydrofolate reductase [NAD(P)H] [Planctomycetales bacterium]
MNLSQAYGDDRFGLSFELFPPKTDAGLTALEKHVSVLCEYSPSFITCTYGAGGSTRDKTLEILKQVKCSFNVPVASHLTCVGSTVESLREYLATADELKIENIVALRGDPPKGESEFKPVEGGLSYANELVQLIKSEFPQFGIAVAGYPEKHQEAPDMATDLQNLKRKVDAGADAVITQLFYDNADFFRFRDSCEQLGIDVPIVPGILPVTNLGQITRITSLCGSKLPQRFIDRMSEQDTEEWQFSAGVEFATQQTQELVEQGIPGIHFYVLNKSQATQQVLNAVTLP